MLNLERKSWEAVPLAAGPAAGLSWRAIGLGLAYLVLGAFTLSPLLWVSIPPLVDYPNHLTRMAVLLHGNDGSAVATNYIVHWRLVPNLAMDLVVPLLAQLFPLEAAGRVFLALILALLVLGTILLHRVLYGRIGLWPLTSLLFLYNAVLWFGFVNYLFSLGVALLAFAAWIATEPWPRAPRLLLFTAIASAIFVLHLFAFGVYGLLVASYEAGRLYGKHGWSRTALGLGTLALLPFLPAAFLWLLSAGGPLHTVYGSLAARIFAFIAPSTFNDPRTLLDAAILMIEIVVLPAALFPGVLRVAPAMRLPLVAMLILSALIPQYLSGSWAAQIRLPVALIFVLIASTRPDPGRPFFRVAFAAAFLVLLGLRVTGVSLQWRDMDPRIAELRAALQTVSPGVRVLTVQSEMPDGASQGGPRSLIASVSPWPYTHLNALAVLDRGAFIVPLFTTYTPIEPSPRNRDMSRIDAGNLGPQELLDRMDSRTMPDALKTKRDELGEIPCCLDWPRDFDFLLWLDFGQRPPELPRVLQPQASGSFFTIYRIDKPSTAQP